MSKPVAGATRHFGQRGHHDAGPPGELLL